MDQRIRKISVKSALSAIADIAMPRVCVVCGAPLIPQEHDICTICLADFPRTRFSTMSHNAMADKFNAMIALNEGDTGCRYCRATALFYYDEDADYKKITQSLKYNRNFGAGKHFAGMLGAEMASSDLFCDVDVVVPVPLHWTRKWKRGYNQSEIIGRVIASALSCPTDCNVLTRTRRTHTQTKLNVEEKFSNVKDAFKARPGKKFKHILLVDDVFTTGSTLSECYKALRKYHGPETRISVATLGYVK